MDNIELGSKTLAQIIYDVTLKQLKLTPDRYKRERIYQFSKGIISDSNLNKLRTELNDLDNNRDTQDLE